MLYECEKVIEYCKPKYLLMENVKNLVGKKFKSQFDEWLNYLESLGYRNYWKVLNAKDYGIPQNRERVFVVSVLGEHKSYEFPKGFELNKNIKSILEDNIDEKYYLSDDVLKKFVPNKNFYTDAIRGRYNENGKIEQKLELRNDNITNTITTVQKDNVIVENKILDVGYIKKSENGTKHQSNTVIDEDYIMRTLTACDYKSPQLIVVDKNIKPSVRVNFEREKYEISTSDKEIYQCKCNSGWQDNKVDIKVSPTLRAGNPHTCVYSDYRIRKLTPRECFRLMGLYDEDIQKIIDSGVSATQQYKMAGNSIVVQVLEEIFKELFRK